MNFLEVEGYVVVEMPRHVLSSSQIRANLVEIIQKLKYMY